MDTRALLVGTATFTHPSTPPVPAATRCVNDLADALSAETHAIIDPQDSASVLRRYEALAAEPVEVLLFYYVGHGLLDSYDHLHLGLTGSIDDPRHAAGRHWRSTRSSRRVTTRWPSTSS